MTILKTWPGCSWENFWNKRIKESKVQNFYHTHGLEIASDIYVSSTCCLTLLLNSDSASLLHQSLLSIHFLNLVTGSRAHFHHSISSTGRYLVESSDVEWCPTRYVRACNEKDQTKICSQSIQILEFIMVPLKAREVVKKHPYYLN